MREQDASDAPSGERTDEDGNRSHDAGSEDGTDEEATVRDEAAGADGAEVDSEEAGDEASSDEGAVGAGESPASTSASDPSQADHPVDEELVQRVEDAEAETIAREIAALRVEIDGLEGKLTEREETIEGLEATVDDLESKLARARADFKNYKKRTEQRREEERERATADLVERLLGVYDNLERALEQDEDVDIRGGVESTLQQFDDVLAAENVTPIEPEPGEEVDPHRHEVLVRVASDRPEGRIEDVHRVGHEMAGTIVREAQVTVSDGSNGDQ